MSDVFGLPFMQRAVVAGCMVGFLGSYFGVFVVQRRLSFLGAGLAHAAFGGVALGLLLQTEPLWIAVPFTIVVALVINWIRTETNLAGDTAIGIVFAVAVALGIIFLSLRESYTGDAFAYLFGSILAVTRADLWITLALTILVAAMFPFWGRWAYATFDAELSRADRLPVVADDYLLSVLLAVTVVVTVKLVGILLVAAFLVIPAASARLVSATFLRMTIVSVAIGVASAAAGLLLSYGMDVPSGATIILVQAGIFAGAAILSARFGPQA